MEEKRTGFRLEHDSIGDKQVPKEAYYGDRKSTRLNSSHDN